MFDRNTRFLTVRFLKTSGWKITSAMTRVLGECGSDGGCTRLCIAYWSKSEHSVMLLHNFGVLAGSPAQLTSGPKGALMTRVRTRMTGLAVAATIGIAACGPPQPKPGTVKDEALRANRTAQSFPAAGEDYFHDMDGGLPFSPDEIK